MLGGNPGTGKTILAATFLHHGSMVEKERSLYISLVEDNARPLNEMIGRTCSNSSNIISLESELKFVSKNKLLNAAFKLSLKMNLSRDSGWEGTKFEEEIKRIIMKFKGEM